MLCGSVACEKYNTCRYAIINNPGVYEDAEPFDHFGWGSYTFDANTREVITHHETMCNNFSMYSPKGQVTMDEILKENYQ